MSYIPAGSLAFSGFANSTPQQVKFRSNTGALLTHPVAAPVIGNPSSDYCDGLVQLDGGSYICGSTLTFSGHTWGGERFDSAFGSGTPLGVIDDEPWIRSGVASDGTYAWGIFYHFDGGPKVAFSRWANDGTYTTQVTAITAGTNAGDVLAISGGIIYWGQRGDTTLRRWDTSGGGSALSDWSVTAPAGYDIYDGTVLGLQDGTIVIAWRKVAAGTSILMRYDTSGSVLNTYAVPGGASNSGPSAGGSLAQGLTASTFWYNTFRTDLGGGFNGNTLREYNASTGATVNEFSPASDGYEWDSPFVVVRSAIGTPPVAPIPLPTPLAPQTPCDPQSQVSGGGKGNAGCNTGGVGFTLDYAGPWGDIPNHPDPVDGESMKGKTDLDLWIAWHHVNYPSGTIDTYKRSFEDLAHDQDYYGGRKTKGLLSIGAIVHGLWRDFQAGTVDLKFSEAIHLWIRELLVDQDLEGDEIEVYMASTRGALAGVAAHTLMRAVVESVKGSSGLVASVTAVDSLFSITGPLGRRPEWPFWKFGDVFDAATCPADVRERVIPILYGPKTDKNPTSGTSKGLCPLYYVGSFVKTTGITRPDTPGRTLAALVAALQVSVDAHTTVADWASVPADGDFTGFGFGDCAALEALGTVPNTYLGLAEGSGISGFDGLGKLDVNAWLAAGTTAAPTSERYGFFSSGLGAWYRFDELYGSNGGNGDPSAKHDRTLIDVASRSDVLMYGVNYDQAYEEFTNADGVTFWLSGIWVHESSPLFQDHVNGVVNMTVNAWGRMGLNGYPLYHVHRVEHAWIENDLLNNWTSGAYADDVTYPQWPDGTAKVRSSRFHARQAITADALGDGIGLKSGWYVDEAKPLSEWFQIWGDSSETELGPNRFGQVSLGYVDKTSDPNTWPLIEETVDIYGSVDSAYGDNRQNARTIFGDWDPDAEKFRIGPITEPSTEAIARLKGLRRPYIINSTILNNADDMTWVLEQGLDRLKFGEDSVTIVGKVDLLDYDVDSPGIRLTTREGRGTNGLVAQPMRVVNKRFDFSTRLSTDRLVDVGRLYEEAS